ncbi:NUDIX hydrolase [Lactobacillus sp. PFC-70]|nr:NUDIX hydrolase [Lactobacillus sp. PFC-70]
MPADQLHEHWDVYNRQLQRVGDQLRENPVTPGHYHLVVNAFLFNPAGQVLLQQRALNKLNFPGYWDTSSGGAVKAGETIEEAMHREMTEELGFDHPVTAADNYRIMPHSHWVSAWFAFQTDWTTRDFTIQTAELQRICYFDFPAALDHLDQIGFDNCQLELRGAWEHLYGAKKTNAT